MDHQIIIIESSALRPIEATCLNCPPDVVIDAGQDADSLHVIDHPEHVVRVVSQSVIYVTAGRVLLGEDDAGDQLGTPPEVTA